MFTGNLDTWQVMGGKISEILKQLNQKAQGHKHTHTHRVIKFGTNREIHYKNL